WPAGGLETGRLRASAKCRSRRYAGPHRRGDTGRRSVQLALFRRPCCTARFCRQQPPLRQGERTPSDRVGPVVCGRWLGGLARVGYRVRPSVYDATCGLSGESPWPGLSTTTGAPTLTRPYRSITSSLVMRMQPDEIAWPIYSG